MPDHATGPLPRIALVFGEEAAVAHLREAMAGHADIAYVAAAEAFDAARLVAAGARSALVNLDGGDWLDDVETKLHAAGVAVVFNDSEISQKLEGWERARWLRHLLAKLRGSSDVDPPRPDAGLPPVVPASKNEVVVPVDEVPAPPAKSVVVERPLSPEEIETMTVDFVAEQPAVAVPLNDPVPAATRKVAADDQVVPLDVPEPMAAVESSAPFGPAAESAAAAEIADVKPEAIAAQEEPTGFDFEAEAALDVDTEALSAMIDARLAEPQASDPDSQQVWRVVSDAAVSPMQPQESAQANLEAPTPLPDAMPTSKPAAAVNDDADVLASLPSLDDWALVDHDVAPAPAADKAARKTPEPALSDALAGLELVPMETIVPLRIDADPIERWFAEELGKPKAGADDSAESGMKKASHEHG